MAQTNCPCCCCTCTALSAICGLCTDALQSNFLAMPWGTLCCVHLCLYCSMQCTMKSVGQQRPSIAAAAGKVQRRWDVKTYARVHNLHLLHGHHTTAALLYHAVRAFLQAQPCALSAPHCLLSRKAQLMCSSAYCMCVRTCVFIQTEASEVARE